jgi:drug/metabolite transporter (DMT)-like permease
MAYNYNVDAVSLLALRMLFSLPFFIIIVIISNIRNKRPDLERGDWLKVIFLGIIGYYLASYFDFSGLKYITAGLERLILFIYPTLVVLLSSLLFKRPIGKKIIFALFLTYGGILLVVLNDLTFYQNNVVLGSLLIFGSALTYAMYLVGVEKLIPVIGTIRFTAYAMIVSSIAVLIHYSFLESATIFNLDKKVYFLSMLMAVLSTVIPSFFISEGIRMIGSGKAAIIGSVGPVSTIILASFFLGESISLYHVFGTVLVLSGVIMVSSNKDFINKKVAVLRSK